LCDMLKQFPVEEQSTSAFQSFRSAAVREAIALAGRQAPQGEQLKVLVSAAEKEGSKALVRLTELAASPALLASVRSHPPQDAPLRELQAAVAGVLGPFASAKVETPRLEAAWAARLLGLLGTRSPLEASDVKDLVAAVLEFRESSLVLMPAFVEVLVERLTKAKLPKHSSTDADGLRHLMDRLLRIAGKTAKRSSGDEELDSWLEKLDRIALEDRRKTERTLESLERDMQKKVGRSVSDALGPGWLGMLLVRSRKVVWNGKLVRCDSGPRPRTLVKRLAMLPSVDVLLSSTTRTEAAALVPEGAAPPPTSRTEPPRTAEPTGTRRQSGEQREAEARDAGRASYGRAPVPPAQAPPTRPEPFPTRTAQAPSGPAPPRPAPRPPTRPPPSNSDAEPPRKMQRTGALIVKAGFDKEMGETLAGTYVPSSMNHNHSVFKRVEPAVDSVLLYYWDDRDGEEQKGWWFGPEVGGEEVWAHNAGSDSPGSKLPPTRGWTVLITGALDPGLEVTRADPVPQPSGPQLPMRGSVAGAQASSAAAPSSRPAGPPPQLPRPPPGRGAPPPAAAQRRPRVDDARADELRAWLNGLDDGQGAMLSYFDVLATEFDADLAQIAAAKVEGGRGMGAVDPSFWDTVKVQKTGHKFIFARGIQRL